MLVINADGHQGAIDTACVMWTISFHGSNHYNSIRLPGNPPLQIRHIKYVQHFQSYLQQALDKYQDDLTIISSMSCTKGHPIPTIAVESLRETTGRMMSYIALQILSAGGDPIFGVAPQVSTLPGQGGCHAISTGGHCCILLGRFQSNTSHRESCCGAVCGGAQGNH